MLQSTISVTMLDILPPCDTLVFHLDKVLPFNLTQINIGFAISILIIVFVIIITGVTFILSRDSKIVTPSVPLPIHGSEYDTESDWDPVTGSVIIASNTDETDSLWDTYSAWDENPNENISTVDSPESNNNPNITSDTTDSMELNETSLNTIDSTQSNNTNSDIIDWIESNNTGSDTIDPMEPNNVDSSTIESTQSNNISYPTESTQ